MNQRIAAALIGTTMGLATFAGSTIAVSAAAPEAEPPRLQQDQVSEVICSVLEQLDLLDHPSLADLVKSLKCEDSDEPTETTTSASEPGEHGRR